VVFEVDELILQSDAKLILTEQPSASVVLKANKLTFPSGSKLIQP
jgi:hypothetical protein